MFIRVSFKHQFSIGLFQSQLLQAVFVHMGSAIFAEQKGKLVSGFKDFSMNSTWGN